MEFLCFSKCNTCRKAKKWLEGNEISYTERPITEVPPTVDELKKWIEASERPIKSFFNTSGVSYRSLNLKEKLPSMTDQEKIELLASDPMLIKRPVAIFEDGTVLSGFKEVEWRKKFGIYK